MLISIFLRIFNLSMMAGWMVLAVLLLRLCLKKAPRWITCVLWGLVALRLLMPFTIESPISLIPTAETVISGDTADTSAPVVNSGVVSVDKTLNDWLQMPVEPQGKPPVSNTTPGASEGESNVTPQPPVEDAPTVPEETADAEVKSVSRIERILQIAARVWLVGIGLMLLYELLSVLRVRRRVLDAVLLRDNIWQSDRVSSPFIFGLFRPRIYVPYDLEESMLEQVLSHEQAHLHRRDHWIKPFAFTLLAVYWYNPLLWVGYILLCRDIEVACDQRVVRGLDEDSRRQYATALLQCGVERRSIAACPLAFGEVSIKQRIKSVLNYRKPLLWVIIASLVVCAVAAVCLLTVPKTSRGDDNDTNATTTYPIVKIDLPEYFLAVMQGEQTFVMDEGYSFGGEAITISRLLGKYNIDHISRYTLVDMDADDSPELVIVFSSQEDNLVIKKDGNNYYGHLFGMRAMYRINQDGTYLWNKNAGKIHGCSRLRFDGTQYTETELWREELNDDDTFNFFVDGKAVTEEVYLAVTANLADEVAWAEWDETQQGSNAITYIPYDTEQSAEYNNAIGIYNNFLSGLIPTQGDTAYYVTDCVRGSNGKSGIDSYALADVNGDNIPELFIHAMSKEVLGIVDGELTCWYSSGGSVKVSLLENGALFATSLNLLDYHTYITFDNKGSKNEIYFYKGATGPNKPITYTYEGDSVAKEEWESLTAPYFAQAKKTVELQWYEWTEPTNMSNTTTTVEEQYTAFLQGEIGAVDKDGNRVYLRDYLNNDYDNRYAQYDINDDSRLELLLRTRDGLCILCVKEQTLQVWYSGTIYEKPLNNGAIFYERPGGAPEHTDYAYITLDENGEETERLSFSAYDDQGQKTYFVDNKEVNAAEYQRVYDTVMPKVKDDAILWKHLTTPGTWKVHKSGENFTIYTDGMNFQYTVAAADGSVLDQGKHDYRGAFDITADGDLLVLESGSGGNARSNYRYFDVQKGRVSPFFHNVLAVNGTRVAYMKMKTADSKSVLVVQDMFDPAHYYTEIQRDFAEGTLLYYCITAAFKNNGEALEITYPYAEATEDTPAQYKTETILLGTQEKTPMTDANAVALCTDKIDLLYQLRKWYMAANPMAMPMITPFLKAPSYLL